jgi:hypothetical protein
VNIRKWLAAGILFLGCLFPFTSYASSNQALVRKDKTQDAAEQEARTLHENTLRYGVTLDEARQIVKDDTLYQSDELPPVTDKMQLLNQVFGQMMHKENINLVMREMRKCRDEARISVGNPTLLFYAVDTSDYKITDLGKENYLVILMQFIVQHRKESEKSFTLVPLGYMENRKKHTFSLLDFSTYSKKQFESIRENKDFLKAPQVRIEPNSRDEAIAKMVFSSYQKDGKGKIKS